MSIPLDRLYHFLDSLHQDPILIYQFYPHGSKNLQDLKCETKCTVFDSHILPPMIHHDQEPLNVELYSDSDCLKNFEKNFRSIKVFSQQQVDCLLNNCADMNLRLCITNPFNCYDLVMLSNSEKRSINLQKYEQNGFIGVYYWSHAMIALDWYRYAQHINIQTNSTKVFLIYNRAWAGTREYRIKFTDLLISHGLVDSCLTWFNANDPDSGLHYHDHKFSNNGFRSVYQLEKYFPPNNTSAEASADFKIEDYVATDIEVILETLFDDERLHLTEKTLRAIAMAKPFILTSTHGSLQYLKDYGFKTFDTVWNEDYDKIVDPIQRLQSIIALMKDISKWDAHTRLIKMKQAQEISNFNKNLFFSSAWKQKIINEYSDNLTEAMKKMKLNCSGKYYHRLLTLLDQVSDPVDHDKIMFRQKVINWVKHHNSGIVNA